MTELLSENALWLGALGAIASIIALFTPLLKKKSESSNVTAKNGGVAAGGDMKGVIITMNKPDPEKKPSDIDT